MYSLSQISEWMQGSLQGTGSLQNDWHLLIDSRTITFPESSIFFALSSQFNDGHKYIPELVEKGVRVFVVRKGYVPDSAADCNFIFVENVLEALQRLAARHRQNFSIPVIGITGSNGKTIVKEWLLHILGQAYHICHSPKSYNSQIGVPLSVWQMNPRHELGIFEAGISTTGEMEHLERIIRPDIGILTHLGPAHGEGFKDQQEKISEKLRLFSHSKVVLMRFDPEIAKEIKAKVLSFGYNEPDADLNITKKEAGNNGTTLYGRYKGQEHIVRIPFTDEASIENCSLCWLVALHLGHFDSNLFGTLMPVSMRMELKKGVHNCLIVNDSYSNDIHSLGSALAFLRQQSIHSKTTVILSDIEQSGLAPERLCMQVRNMLQEKRISRLIAIGPQFYNYQSILSGPFESLFFRNTQDFLSDFYNLHFQDETILVKGARKFQFEKISRKLEQLSHGTVLEINLHAALDNLAAIRKKLPREMKIMAMVKAFAYGSGTYEMAKLLQNRVDYLAVAYPEEGVSLRSNGITTPIMVLNPEEEALDSLVEYQLEPVVFSTRQLDTLTRLAGHETIPIHLEIDTGMHRLGFLESDIPVLLDQLKQYPRLRIASVFSHLSASDEVRYDDFTKSQFDQFKRVATEIENAAGYKVLKHISNTAAALRFGQEGLDMVRLGIGLYGIDPSGVFPKLLEPVFTLKTTISQIKKIGPNESVGYSRKAVSDHGRTIAILALGYADGLNRLLGNGNAGFDINGQEAPIVGNVCMDMCMVDVSGIACEEGDEAVLFGRHKPIQDIAAAIGSIPYEVLTSISQRVKRIYVSE